MSTLRDRRLHNTYLVMKELAEKCLKVRIGQELKPRFEFVPNGKIEAGEPPDMYDVTLRVKGVENRQERYRYEHKCTIYLPAEYPKVPPIIKWHTPIFHPNILTFDETNEVYQELCEEFGGEAELNKNINKVPRLAELLDAYVCLDTLRENWTPFVGLDALVIEMANMVRYRTYTANNAFNEVAAEWAKEKEKLNKFFPLDDGLLEIESTGSLTLLSGTDQ